MIKPIIIIGIPRSGTTLLRVILDSHSLLLGAPETPWIAGGYGAASVRRLVDYASAPHGPLKNLIGVDEDIVYNAARLYTDHILSSYLGSASKENLVLKTPDDCRHLQFMLRLFKESHFLHIYRDGRDVACSTVDKRLEFDPRDYFGKITVENALRHWFVWEQEIRSQFAARPALKKLTIRYEDLVSNPGDEIQRICSFLDMPFETQMIDYASSSHFYPEWEAGSRDVKHHRRITSASVGRWRQDLSRRQARKAADLYGSFLSELGYDLL